MNRIERLIRPMTFANLGIAITNIYLSGEVGWLVWAVCAAGMLLAWRMGRQELSKKWRNLMTLLVTGALLSLTAMAIATGAWLLYSVYFALVAIWARAAQSHTARQYFQLIVLSFLALVAGSVMNPDMSFALLFIPYTVTLVWSLMLSHFLQRIEEGVLAGALWKMEAVLSPRLFVLTSVLSILMLFFSLSLFFLFPRLGLGFFSKQTRGGSSVTGFGSEIELGEFGKIDVSTNIVLRLQPKLGNLAGTQRRLTGITFDYFNGSGWENRLERTAPLRVAREGHYRTGWDQIEAERLPFLKALEYDIYLEPIGSNSIFGFGHVARLKALDSGLDRYR